MIQMIYVDEEYLMTWSVTSFIIIYHVISDIITAKGLPHCACAAVATMQLGCFHVPMPRNPNA